MYEIWTTVCGTVATDPRHISTERGVPMIRFRVASTPGSYEQGHWVDRPTSFLTVTGWRNLANNAASSLVKGQPVVAYGKLTVREYPGADGRQDREVQLEAVAIGHNLARGTTAFHRPARAAPAAELPDGMPDIWEPLETGQPVAAAAAALGSLTEPDDMAPAGLASDFGRPGPLEGQADAAVDAA